MKATEYELIRVLNLTAYGSVVEKMIEDLKRTTFYRHKIKHHAKALSKELAPIVEDNYNRLFNADEKNTEAMFDICTDLLENIFKVPPERWQVVAFAAKCANSDELYFARLKALMMEHHNKNKN